MSKDTPTKVYRVTTYHSMGYSPSFCRCPNCSRDIPQTWSKPEACIYCGQKLLWEELK